jgi:threonine dehydrogenase-like Zn-dependent dehydrogenase
MATSPFDPGQSPQLRFVISSGNTPQSTALARQSGAHHVFDYKRDDIAAEIARLTGGRGVDLVVDATYSEAGFVETAKTVRPGGSWVVLGVGPGKRPAWSKPKARSTPSWRNAVPGISMSTYCATFLIPLCAGVTTSKRSLKPSMLPW